MRVQLGTKAGISYLLIRVPALRLLDSVRVTVSPGDPWVVSGEPLDTVLFVGESYRLRQLSAYDVSGNLRPEPPTPRSLDGCLTITANLVSATSTCRATIELRAGNAWSWIFASVPPNLTLSTVYGNEVRIHRTNGTVLQTRALPPVQYFPFSSDWSPDGQYFVLDGGGSSLRLLSPSGVVTPLGDPAYYALYPRFSADGLWVYYGRQSGPLTWEVRRIQRDGQRDSLLAVAGDMSPAPSPSPDGRKVAYLGPGHQLIVLDLVTGVSTTIGSVSTGPAWSPVADEIAVGDAVSGQLEILRSDGTLLKSFGYGIDAACKWSSDGSWLLHPLPGLFVALVDRVKGNGIQLFSPNFGTAPTWKP